LFVRHIELLEQTNSQSAFAETYQSILDV